MKRSLSVIAIIVMQAIATLLLARLVREFPHLFSGVTLSAAVAYGLPSLLAFICLYRLKIIPFSLGRAWPLRAFVAALLTVIGQTESVFVLQRSDMWLTHRYVTKTQAQLKADRRYADVRLVGYSNDYILFPYIPVGGAVATEEARQELAAMLRASSPPALISAKHVHVGRNLPSDDSFRFDER